MERYPPNRASPKFRCRMYPTVTQRPFSPPFFSGKTEKKGPSEARQKRPRRNESLQARLLILCARFFLSKPQTEFAVWVFPCRSATTSQSRLRRASIPTPFVPSGHFPLIGGIGPWEGSPWVRQPFRVCLAWARAWQRAETSASVLSRENETRMEPSMTAGGRPMASSTWLRCPFEQAEPAET